MKFQIDKQKLSEDQLLFLANFELSLKQYIEKILADYPNLGVTPIGSVWSGKIIFLFLKVMQTLI